MKIADAAADLIVEAIIEIVLATSPVCAIMEMEVPASSTQPAEVLMEVLRSTPSSSSAIDNLKIVVEFLESIDRQDDELSRACPRIEVLERQRFKAEWDCRQAHDDIKCLKRMIEERKGSSLEVHLPQGFDRWPIKRHRSSSMDCYEGETSRRPKVSLSRGGRWPKNLQHPKPNFKRFEIPELKELLSEQILFNVGISQVSSEGRDLSPSKALGPKTLQKKKAEVISGRSTRAWAELLLMPPTSEIKEFDPPKIKDFQVVQVPHDSNPLVPKGNSGIPVECLFSEVILSLPALDISDFFPKEEPTKGVETFGVAMDGVQLAEAVETFKIASIGIFKTASSKARVIEATETFGTTPAEAPLEASTLEDYV
ncbi:hypothetical protein COCNU_01G013200 [Cocos nucifera]|uniref:Uncharacterized protein n=1 Tax=Cocos nucifera TaxID=13894 RepID=A0A8K0MUV1_COCNU|nr:hypothetical protein COCNU_01G013200 [Cocos nucifera]